MMSDFFEVSSRMKFIVILTVVKNSCSMHALIGHIGNIENHSLAEVFIPFTPSLLGYGLVLGLIEIF